MLVGLPACEDDEDWHRPEAETIERGPRGVRRGLAGRAPEQVRGVAIHAVWTMDADARAIFEREWVEREATGAAVSDR